MNLTDYPSLSRQALVIDSPLAFRFWAQKAVGQFTHASITVFGDFCLDAYWLVDSSEEERSVETGLPLRRVKNQRYSLGGAGSVVANLSALGVGTIRVVGVAGADLFGHELTKLLEREKVALDGWFIEPDLQTLVYAKPCHGQSEESRIDFGAFNTYSQHLEDRVIAALDAAVEKSDAVILNQQIPCGITKPSLIRRVNGIIRQNPHKLFLVDSRHFAGHFAGVALKVNTREALELLGEPQAEELSEAEAVSITMRIQQRQERPTFLTRGDRGLIAVDQDGSVLVAPGIQVVERIDTVGAGDTVVASIAAAMAVGETVARAAQLANVAASITIRQLQRAGVASAEEVLGALDDLNYVFQPGLAESPRAARYLPGSEIEIVAPLPSKLKIQHCIFDHDGTLSVLREGWEHIMEPMMMRAILGCHFDSVDESVFETVRESTRQFIDRTTGIQTLVQMKGLVDMVRQGGFVEDHEILDEHGYKHMYNVELLKLIQGRVEKLKSGELSSDDFQIKNAKLLLEELYRRGVRLYLASGTDEADVIAEAEAMGYAHLFEGRIFGAVGDIKVEAKKMVLERIIRDHQLSGHEFATFGDGPVELRETRKRDGIAVGVASDEVRRFGLNLIKRKRLIRAGANLIVPDYCQLPTLLQTLQLA